MLPPPPLPSTHTQIPIPFLFLLLHPPWYCIYISCFTENMLVYVCVCVYMSMLLIIHVIQKIKHLHHWWLTHKYLHLAVFVTLWQHFMAHGNLQVSFVTLKQIHINYPLFDNGAPKPHRVTDKQGGIGGQEHFTPKSPFCPQQRNDFEGFESHCVVTSAANHLLCSLQTSRQALKDKSYWHIAESITQWKM